MGIRRAASANRLVVPFCLALFLHPPPVPGHESPEAPAAPATLFIVEFTTGPAWLPDKAFQDQPHAAGHSANLRRLREQGLLVMGARHGSKGMVLLRASSEAAARSAIEKDPTIAASVFTYALEEFRPFYGGCVELPRSADAKPPRLPGIAVREATAFPAPLPEPIDGIYRVGGEVKPPERMSGEAPVYTQTARRARLRGVVIVEAVIEANGSVSSVRVLKPLPMGLDQSAVNAVRTWSFKPARLRGRAVPVYLYLTVKFDVQ